MLTINAHSDANTNAQNTAYVHASSGANAKAKALGHWFELSSGRKAR